MSRMLTAITTPRELQGKLPEGTKMYSLGLCTVMVGFDWIDAERTERRHHLSIAHPARYPSWDESGEARDRLLPADAWMAVPHPPRAYWLSHHPNCFHLWEIKDPMLIAQMKWEGERAKGFGFGTPQPELSP